MGRAGSGLGGGLVVSRVLECHAEDIKTFMPILHKSA